MDDELLAGLRQIDKANATPLHDALTKLGTSGDGLEIAGGRDRAGHVGVSASVTKDLGKGWSIAAAAQWAKDAGYAALGKLSWKPK